MRRHHIGSGDALGCRKDKIDPECSAPQQAPRLPRYPRSPPRSAVVCPCRDAIPGRAFAPRCSPRFGLGAALIFLCGGCRRDRAVLTILATSGREAAVADVAAPAAGRSWRPVVAFLAAVAAGALGVLGYEILVDDHGQVEAEAAAQIAVAWTFVGRVSSAPGAARGAGSGRSSPPPGSRFSLAGSSTPTAQRSSPSGSPSARSRTP